MPTNTHAFEQTGARIRVLIPSRETGGEYTVCDLETLGSFEIPAHQHAYEDQWYQVLAGHFEFDVGGQAVSGGPGTTVTVPRDTPSRIRCQTPGRLLVVARPGGLDLFISDAHATALERDLLRPVLEKHGIRTV